MVDGVHFDVLAYCNRRLEPQVMDAIIKANRSGLNTPGLEDNLNNGIYSPVLSAVWGERNKKKRLVWLRENAGLHPPFMYELAMAEFVADPTADKVIKTVLPLMRNAAFRVYQDTACLKNQEMGNQLNRHMFDLYMTLLIKAKMRYAPELDLKNILKIKLSEIDKYSNLVLRLIAKISKEKPKHLPNPVWVSFHNCGEQYPMHPTEKFVQIRQRISEKENVQADLCEILALS